MKTNLTIFVVILTLAVFSFRGNATVLGFDVYATNTEVTNVTAKCMVNMHKTMFGIVKAVSPFGSLYPYVISSLQGMQKGGVRGQIQINTCREKPAAQYAQYLLGLIPNNLYSRIWVYLAQNYGAGCQPWWNWSVAQNCQYLVDFMTALKKSGKEVGVYVTAPAWIHTFQAIDACPQAAIHGPIWFVNQDNKKTMDGYQKIGGWTTPTTKTFSWTVNDSSCKLSWNQLISVS